MENLAELMERMRQARRRVQGKLAGVTSQQLELPSQWKQNEVNVRFFFYRLLAHQIEHTVQMVQTMSALDIKQTEAQLILGRLQAACGDLEGLLIGLSDEALDKQPGPGQWSVREVLEHIIKAEQNYLGRIEQALAKA